MDEEVRGRFRARAVAARLTLPDLLVERLLTYYALLTRWNRVVNLTALEDPDAAIDRLLLEPVAAAAHLPLAPTIVDLGSGGGSPAIPLALALGATQLRMIEARSRKTAFLREAVRELGINARVEPSRFDEVLRGTCLPSPAVVSARAVRLGRQSWETIADALGAQSYVALFLGASQRLSPADYPSTLREVGRYPLVPANQSRLMVLTKVFGNVPRGTSGSGRAC
jgi:16S rRNA (guanine(527)-N(7))-methyltransferase RsmG